MELSGKVCVVTGASSGIGRQTALDLGRAGARVCVVARREDRLRDVMDAMSETGDGHSLLVADVAKKGDVRALKRHIEETYGRLDVLINNAGFSNERPLWEHGGVGDLEKTMKTNFFGAVYCTAELLPLLTAATPSSVVNVASIAGRLAFGGAPAYCASKFALVGWSEAMTFQLRSRNVHVGLVEPGLIPTEGFPQTDALADPILRYAVGNVEQVSDAILDAIQHRKPERVVPRFYYLFQLPRLLAPPLYRLAQEKLLAAKASRALNSGSS